MLLSSLLNDQLAATPAPSPVPHGGSLVTPWKASLLKGKKAPKGSNVNQHAIPVLVSPWKEGFGPPARPN